MSRLLNSGCDLDACMQHDFDMVRKLTLMLKDPLCENREQIEEDLARYKIFTDTHEKYGIKDKNTDPIS